MRCPHVLPIILLWMPETGRKALITQNTDPSKMGSRRQRSSHHPRGRSGCGGSHTARVPTRPGLPSATLWTKLVSAAWPHGWAKANDTVALLFTLLVPWPQGAITFYSYLLSLPFVCRPDSPELSHHPEGVYLKSQSPHMLSFWPSEFLLSSLD